MRSVSSLLRLFGWVEATCGVVLAAMLLNAYGLTASSLGNAIGIVVACLLGSCLLAALAEALERLADIVDLLAYQSGVTNRAPRLRR